MKQIICCLFVILATAVLASAAGVVVDGRPGHYDMSSATIDVVNNQCIAYYADPVNGNLFIDNSGAPDSASFKVIINKNMVKASCKFVDISGVFEKNAEVGDILDCTLITEEGSYFNGTGQVVSAANFNKDVTTGGNTTISCTFK
jgi:hypothetical protein